MRRVIEIAAGVLVLIASVSIIVWIPYSYTLNEPSKYPWWWGVALFIFWCYAAIRSVGAIRGRNRKKAPEKPESWGVDG